MGCHTWFYRPLTEDEFNSMKENAPEEIYALAGNSKENLESGMYNKILYNLLMKSYSENIPCVYGKYWWQLGWGGKELYPTELHGEAGLFTKVKGFHDTFRIKN